MAAPQTARARRPHLKDAICDYLAGRGPAAVPFAEIREGIRHRVGDAPDSSVRGALRDDRYFERLFPGVFRLRHPTTVDHSPTPPPSPPETG